MSHMSNMSVEQLNREVMNEKIAQCEQEITHDKFSNNFEQLEEDTFDTDAPRKLAWEKAHQLDGYHIIHI